MRAIDVFIEGQLKTNMVANRDCSLPLDYYLCPQVAHVFIFRAVELFSVITEAIQLARETVV